MSNTSSRMSVIAPRFSCMTERPLTLDHPVLTCARELDAALDRVAGIDPVLMPTSVKAAALKELSRVAERTRGLMLRVLANSEDVALDDGARSAAVWLAVETRSVRGTRIAAGRLAEALEERRHLVRDSLMGGQVNEQQAAVIVRALDDLPAVVNAEIQALAEAYLVAQAADFDAKALRILGRKVLEVVAPDAFDDDERKKLEEEEHRARRTTQLMMRGRGDGTTDIHIRVSDAIAARLRTYLEAYASPRRDHLHPTMDRTDPDTGERISYAVLLGKAFCAMLESIPALRLPKHGGSATTVVVNIDFQALRDQVGSAGLDTGDKISASEAIRLACNASIMPLVLGGEGQPLHLGRARRLFDSKQRLAMAVRDGECRARGCDIPATWCEAHHRGKPWRDGGRTDIDQGVLLCSWHHHRAHDAEYATEHLPSGDVRFRRRT